MKHLAQTLATLRNRAKSASESGDLSTAFAINSAIDDIENAILQDKRDAAVAAIHRKTAAKVKKLGLRMTR